MEWPQNDEHSRNGVVRNTKIDTNDIWPHQLCFCVLTINLSEIAIAFILTSIWLCQEFQPKSISKRRQNEKFM